MGGMLAKALVIQAFGVAVMFLVTLIVSRVGGPAAQGSFAFIKSTADFQVAVFSLGLPQAIVFMLNRRGVGHYAIYVNIARYCFGLMIVLPVLNLGWLWWFAPTGSQPLLLLQALLIGLACAWLTAFSLFRGLLLVFTDGPLFSFLSILQWLIIAVCVFALLNRSAFIFEIAYFAAGAASVAAIVVALRRFMLAGNVQQVGGKIDYAILREQSAHVLLQAVMLGLLPFVTNAVLLQKQEGYENAGLFNIASIVVTLPNLLVALVAPMLFNRWSKSLVWADMGRLMKNAFVIGGMAQFVALVAIPLVTPGISLVFGPAFVGAVEATQILLISVLPIVTGRILTPALQGLGFTREVTISCLWRISSTVGVAAVLLAMEWHILSALAFAWTAGEYAALAKLVQKAYTGFRYDKIQR